MADTQPSLAGTKHADESQNDEKIDLLDAVLFVVENRRYILVTTLLGALVGIALAVFLRPTFSATTVILPPQMQESSTSALMGEIGTLAGLSSGSGMGVGAALKNPADMYVGLLESQTIADGVIQKFHLKRVYQTKTMVDTRHVLKNHVTIEAGKDGLISITATDHNPSRASNLANGYVSGLYTMNSHLAITHAAQRRVFFEKEWNEEKTALSNAEEAFRNMQEKTGLIQLRGQAESLIRSIAELNAEITNEEVKLKAMKTFATDENPDVLREQRGIDELRNQLTKLETTQLKEQRANFEIPAGRVPEAALEYARSFRNLSFHETLYELLAKEYESARIDEAESAPLIQVVDKAVPPEKKSGPHRLLILIGSVFAGFLCGVCWSLMKRATRRMRSDPDRAEKLNLLRRALHN